MRDKVWGLVCLGQIFFLSACGNVELSQLNENNFTGEVTGCDAVENDFSADIVPIFSSNGCSDDQCHGSAENGGLALLGSDIEIYESVTSGERVNEDQVEESLILQKPVLAVSHGGGQLFDGVNDPDYLAIKCWIENGVSQ